MSVEGKALARSIGASYVSQMGNLCIIYLFNCFSGPCTDVRVRQALNLALDREAVVEKIVGGAAEPLTGPLTPLHFGWDPDTLGYGYDPAEARRLLAEAGYASGLKLRLDTPTEMPDEAIPLSRMIAEQLREVGIVVDVRIHDDRPGYAEMVRAKKIGDLCCFDSSPISTFRVMREKIHSGVRGPWWEGYSNLEVDALIGRAQRATDEGERRRIYERAYRLIRDDAPWVFLYRPELTWVVGKSVDWGPSWDGVTRIN